TTVGVSATLTATVNGNSVPVSASASLILDDTPAPHFAGGSGLGWLSADVRVFQVEPGTWTLPWPGHLDLSTGAVLTDTGHPATDATQFIQSVIHQFNTWTPGVQHPFDLISTDENASELDVLPTDPNTQKPVYNFAVARVRYDPTTVNAQAVRVFFRL